MSIINLIDLRDQLQATSTKIIEQVQQSHTPVTLTVGRLKGKCPDLDGLPENVAIFQCDPRENIDLPPIWYGVGLYALNDQVVVTAADLEILEGFEVVKHLSSFSGYAIINHVESGIELQISTNYNDDFKAKFVAQNLEPTLVKGAPDVKKLQELPRPEIPLKSKRIAVGQPLKIVEVTGTSRLYGTPLVNVETLNGVVKNVLTNARLQRIAESFLEGEHDGRFEIREKIAPRSKDGNWKFIIYDPSQPDFSDV